HRGTGSDRQWINGPGRQPDRRPVPGCRPLAGPVRLIFRTGDVHRRQSRSGQTFGGGHGEGGPDRVERAILLRVGPPARLLACPAGLTAWSAGTPAWSATWN